MRSWGLQKVLLLVIAAALVGMTEPGFVETTKPSPAHTGFSQARLHRIDDFFAREIAERKIPGAIVLIQRHGQPIYFKCFGLRDALSGLAMTPDSIFRIFSMSKPVTAVTAMMLIDQGRLKLDDPLSKYIPSFAGVKVGVETIGDDGASKLRLVALERPITIEDLMRQTSGITYGFYGDSLVRREYVKANLFQGPLDNAVFAERIAKLPLAEQPGTVWDYGHSIDILGRVIEIVTGQSLYQAEKVMLLDSLGMTDTAYSVDAAKLSLIAKPLPNDATFAAALEQDISAPVKWEQGGSGLVSTAGDYAKFAQMLLNGGALDGRRYLSTPAFRTMTANHIAPVTSIKRGDYYFPGDGFGYGLGFGVRVDRGDFNPPGSIGEIKWDGAGGTYFLVDPANDMFVIFMVQSPSQRGRIQPELKKMVYDALGHD